MDHAPKLIIKTVEVNLLDPGGLGSKIENPIAKQAADSLKPIMPQAALQQSQETKLTNQATAKKNI